VTSASLPLYPVKAQGTLFKVTIIAPGNANLVRRQWGQIFANSLNLLGIEANVVLLGWTSVYDRVLTPPRSTVGKTWAEGGYDVELMGWTPGLIPEPRQLFYGGSGFFAPDGQNYYLWNNSESNQLLDEFITSTNSTFQDQTLQKWQTVYFNEMPSSQIMYQSAPAVVNPALTNFGNTENGEGWLYFNAQPNPEWLKKGSETNFTATYCSTSEITALVPPLSNSWYDTIIISCIYGGLAMVSSDLSSLHIPSLLTSWNTTDDGFTWNYNVRHGVHWHDWNATRKLVPKVIVALTEYPEVQRID
jgi:ABC-type transport system substrate-binding protein